MAVFAVIEAGLVVNTVLADSPFTENWVKAPSGCSIGWSYADGKFIAPPEPALVAPTKEEQETVRRAAYAAEADPLFFKWQAGEGTEEEWLAKRQEIRDRYPYPAEE